MKNLWQEIQRKVGARPDGEPGEETARRVASALGLVVPEPMPGPWPRDREGEMVAFYGPIGTGHKRIVPPYQLHYDGKPVNAITVHGLVADAVQAALSRVLGHYGLAEIQRLQLDVFDGCYNPRRKRGGTSWSVHAFAAALDFCAAKNSLHQDHTTALFARPEYQAWWEAWESVGAVSLGRARDFDWMHVQFARLPASR